MKNPADASFNLLPHMRPYIRISPFVAVEWEKLLSSGLSKESRAPSSPSFWLKGAKDMQFFSSGRNALLACLIHLKLQGDDEVLIVKNTDGPYISGCVTKTIEKVCRWSQSPSARTKLVLVIHEFGFPCHSEKIEEYQKKGIPVLEDCAYALGSRIEGAEIGNVGDFALYSLPKYYPVPFGGVLVSKSTLKPSSPDLKLSIAEENLLRHTVQSAAASVNKWNTARRRNWERFANELSHHGFEPYFTLTKGVVPGVYLTAVAAEFKGDEVKKRLNDAGVESTQYYHQSGFYFPVHQFLTIWEKDYIMRHFL